MGFKLKIAFHSRLSVRKSFVVVKHPKLDLAIISTSSQQSILEGRPAHIKDTARMAFEKWCLGIKGQGAISVEYGYRSSSVPGDSNHLAICGAAVVLIRV